MRSMLPSLRAVGSKISWLALMAQMGGEQASGRDCRTPCDVGDPKPCLTPSRRRALVGRPRTLHQDVVAVCRPGVRQRGLNNGFVETPTA